MTDQTPTDATPPPDSALPTRYATFTRRFRALVIDTAVIWAVAIPMFLLGDAASGLPSSGRITWLLIVAVFLLYEPVFVSRRGATVGHSVNGLRVVETRTGHWPSFARALARYLIKVVLGLPSFVTMALSHKHQAVHDLLTRTTVQVPTEADSVEFHAERTEEADALLPSRRRRGVVIVLYLVAVLFAYGVALTLVDPAGCARDQSCTGGTRIAVEACAVVWLGLSMVAIVAGWKGFLFGARRTRNAASDVAVA